MAMYIAKVMRDEMEDFYVKHIPDEYMKNFNPSYWGEPKLTEDFLGLQDTYEQIAAEKKEA